MRYQTIGVGLILVFCALICTQPVSAQWTLGSVRGVITDPSGAVVAGAQVVITNKATNASRQVSSNPNGYYEVLSLVPGFYSLRVTASGFKALLNDRVYVIPAGVVRVNVQLSLGAVAEEVTVVGTRVLETESPSIYTFRSGRDLEQLPLNIRTSTIGTGDSGVYVLISHSAGSFSRGDNTSNFQIAGTRSTQNSFTVEGVEVADPTGGFFQVHMVPSFESIREVKVNTSNMDAERQLSAVTDITTKSGGNDWHGSVFWYHINGKLNTRNFFAGRRPFTISNAFGGSLGGPVFREKTFFHVAYEFQRDRTEAVLAANVPTVLMRQGDFSQFLPGLVLKNPFTGSPFPGNIIDPALIRLQAVRYQDRFLPRPNFGLATSVSGNFRQGVRQPIQNDQFDLRIDHYLTATNSLFFRFDTKRTEPRTNEGGLPTVGLRDQVRWPYVFTVSDTHTFTPTVVNEFRFSLSRENNDFGRGPQNGLEILNFLGLSTGTTPPNAAGVPSFSITGFTTASQLLRGQIANWVYTWTDKVSWVRGRHSLKTGAEVRRNTTAGFTIPGDTWGSYTFTGAFSRHAYADFLLGLPQRTARRSPAPARSFTNWNFGFFFQDDFNLNPRLTLNFGLRYDLQTPWVEKRSRQSSFDPTSGAIVVPNDLSLLAVNPLFPLGSIPVVTAFQAGFPESLWEKDTNNFAPRLGLAFRPTGTTDFVIRAGYGLFTDILGSVAWTSGDIFAFPPEGLFTSFETFTNQISGGVPLFQFPQPFLPVGSTGAQSVTPTSLRFRNPYIQQWSLAVEKEYWKTMLRVAYVGTRSTNLGYTRNLNNPRASTIPFAPSRRRYPNLFAVLLAENGADNIYHGLHLEAERRFYQGLGFRASYTWSKNITDVQDIFSDRGRNVIEDTFNRERDRGNNEFTPRQRFVFNGIWEIPAGRGKRYLNGGGATGRILGDWQVSAIAVVQTGLFFTPSFSGSDPSNTNTFGGRPDCLRDPNPPEGQRSLTRWFDPTAFAVPPNGRFGNCGIGILEGPDLSSFSLGVHKNIPVGERKTFRFEATFSNFLNHPNFRNPAANISAPGSVGRITSINSTNDQSGARTVRFGLRFDF